MDDASGLSAGRSWDLRVWSDLHYQHFHLALLWLNPSTWFLCLLSSEACRGAVEREG